MWSFSLASRRWGGLPLSIGVTLVLIAMLIRASGREPKPKTLVRPHQRLWEIPLRMGSTTALLMLIISLASWLGSAASDMLVPIPVIAWSVGVIAFYLVAAGLLERLGLWPPSPWPWCWQ